MATTFMTADELLHTSIPGKRTELVRGVLVVREPAGYRHGRVAMTLGVLLSEHAKKTRAGEVLVGDTGFRLASDPDTVRAPDVAFISAGRVDPNTPGFPGLAPDLAVEVLSPTDRPGETLAKVGDWLEGGALLVWVVDPERHLARVYRADGSQADVSEQGHLEGEDVLPGFTCDLAPLF